MIKISRFFMLLVVVATISVSADGQKKYYNDLSEAMFSAGMLRGSSGPSNVVWIRGGSQYSFTKMNQGAQEIWIHDIKSGEETLAFSATGKSFEDGSDFRYRSFQWAGDYNYVLFQTNFNPIWRYSGNSDYYYYSTENEVLELLVEQAFTAEVSPDGTKLGYGKDGDLYMYTFSTGATDRFTNDATEHFYNGRWGWAYEEEFGLVQAWKWSPDSKYIAFWQSDERHVPIYKLTDFSRMHPEYMEVPYPKVGDPAPYVKLGVINTETGNRKWIDFDLEGGYIPRIYWTSQPGKLAIVFMNRPQNLLELYMADVNSGEKKMVYRETSDTWIDIFDFFANEPDHFYFPEGMEEFFFVSEKDGWAHIYMISYDGNRITQVTDGAYEVIGIKAIDPTRKTLYYVSAEASPLERNLYSVKFNGRSKKRITEAAGNHRVNVSPDGKYYFDKYASVDAPTRAEFSSTDGKTTIDFTDNTRTEKFLEEHMYAPRELFSFTTSDSVELDGYLIRPMDFDPEKSYPLLLDIYGGPGSQGVYNTFGTNGWHQWMAQQGFVIASVNNRGNAGYGSAFEKVVHGQLGKMEARDFVETANYLASRPWVDGERMAIRGHSYGGFMSAYTMVNHPGVFKASIVAAPNADHRLYDCILTERLMGLLEDNEEGYINSAVSTNAGQLEGEMLLVHSLRDENVHPQHTFQLVKAFIDAGKDVDLKIYPPGDHGVAYDMVSYVLMMTQYTDFLMEHLAK
ncbi:MAG: S9 family peptidase [Bacteroidales bacterium]|nr:S9 family peptidase [Bacteroidales bacterium]MDT8431465.1 S9 family peptidase [Bacteroidales bacterium]